jgi:hypothetical protein
MKRLIVPVTVGVVVALAFGIWMFTTRHNATPEVVEGWAMPNKAGTAIAFSGTSYVIAGVSWTGSDNMQHEGGGGPTCVGADPNRQTRVQLGIVYTDVPVVVWLRCLG